MLSNLASAKNPILLYQAMPNGKLDVSALFSEFAKILTENNKQIKVLHLSDEFGHDNLEFYKSPAIKRVIRNYWRPELGLHGDKVYVIPLGYTNNRHSTHYSESPAFNAREHIWSFAGSLDRPGREEAIAILRKTGTFCEKSKPTWSSPAAVDAKEYNTLMRNTKFVPCFRGSSALESYRFYEALEQGAIPIYVASESHNTTDEYQELFGKHPFLAFPSWQTAADTLPLLASQTDLMEKHRQSLQTWWNERKAAVRAKVASFMS